MFTKTVFCEKIVEKIKAFKSYYADFILSFILASTMHHVTCRYRSYDQRERTNWHPRYIYKFTLCRFVAVSPLVSWGINLKFDAPLSVRGNRKEHGTRKSAVCCCGMLYVLLPRGERLRS